MNSLRPQNQHPVSGKLILTKELFYYSTGIFDPVQINQLLSPQSHREDNSDIVTDIHLWDKIVITVS